MCRLYAEYVSYEEIERHEGKFGGRLPNFGLMLKTAAKRKRPRKEMKTRKRVKFLPASGGVGEKGRNWTSTSNNK